MSYNGRVHTVEIAGITRDLPLFEVATGLKIAIFNMLGDTEIVEAAAAALADQMPSSTDVIIVPEVKAVPLGHALSFKSNLPYVVVRKVQKPYMVDCLKTEVVSITTGVPQTLYIDGKDLTLVQSKNALLVDDVISRGSTLRGLRNLMTKANASIVGEMSVFTEGDQSDWPKVIALGHLPIFTE